jgi:His-Xaa-Ser system radical SAM maturase HxsC
MLLKTRGTPHLIKKPIVGPVTRNPYITGSGFILIAEHMLPLVSVANFRALLTALPENTHQIDKSSVYSVGTFDHLADGDIVVINSDGTINTLYRINSHQNFLLFTERCNSNCLMCSQPPKDKDDTSYLFDLYTQLIPLIPKDCIELGITGGEPTLLGSRYFSLLDQIKFHLPDTEIHCLTNGRSFAFRHFAEQLQALNLQRLMLGIPLYSDYYQTHDYIVQAQGAFYQTIEGLYNLALINQRIEIRIVLHKQSIPRLIKLSKFIYKNLPFVEHIAFMGLEFQGYTPHNINSLWIDPALYMNELGEAVEFLSQMGMNVSIYNSQLCVMPKHLWKYNKKSISDWKNIYLSNCETCQMIEACGGLFASCEKMHSEYITPFPEKVEF